MPRRSDRKKACCHDATCGQPAERAPAARLEESGEVHSAGRTIELRVEGMDCADEVALLEKVLRPIEGVHQVRANLLAEKITVALEDYVPEQSLVDAVATTGMRAWSAAEATHPRRIPPLAQRARLLAVSASGLLAAGGILAEWTATGPDLLRLGLYVAAIASGGWFIFPKAVSAARRLSPDMNLLMTVAVMGAALIGEWMEGAVVVFLFGLAELLESSSVNRARRAIQSLMALAPETALLKRGNSFAEVPVADVKVGEMILVRSGRRVPLDGEVVAGSSSVNQAPITGESIPVAKQPGDTILAGTINGEGTLDVRVTQPASHSTLARIIHLVEEAQEQKAPSQRFVDQFARFYTPAVMALALLVFLIPPLLAAQEWETWFYRALVLLVIACPCALVISTPVSVVSGLTAMTRRGVLIKGGAFLEAIGKLRALAVDKTGTITEGRPRVTSIHSCNGMTEAGIVRLAAAIDAQSDHPVAQAIAHYAREQGIDFPRGTHHQARTGRGAEAEVDGHHYFVGNHRFTHELAVCSPALEQTLAEIEEEGQSVVVVGHKPHDDCPGEVLGIIAVGDRIRPNAAAAIRALHEAGVKRIVMLSGDNQRTVDRIAREVGIDEAAGDLLPEDKIARVRQLLVRHQHVGMIGDGVNDAPAMAAASIGIAMGAAGTDTAIETADVALMEDDLEKVAETIHHGRRTLRVIQFNIALAIAVKILFLTLAIAGHATLWLAIAADTGATLMVVANALRLLRT
jgi:Zn2+/Cd2+-exporting ATPase